MKISPIILTAIGLLLVSQGARATGTYNVGAVAANTNTGLYLAPDGSLLTNGEILVGAFTITTSQIESIITGWGSSLPTYERFSTLYSDFIEVGTGGSNGTVVSGWNFNTNGAVAGTSSNVSTAVIPSGSDLYVWAINTTNLTSGGFTAGTEWSLVTATSWIAPSPLSTVSLNLANVTTNGILIGRPAGINSSINLVPEPSCIGFLIFGCSLLLLRWRFTSQKRPEGLIRINE